MPQVTDTQADGTKVSVGGVTLPVLNYEIEVKEDSEGISLPDIKSLNKEPDHRYKLVEMFESVKGEGTQAGIPMLFVRFSKCNLTCSWCDTPYNRIAIELTLKELVSAIRSKDPAWVIFTGGEPMLQLTEDITHPLKRANIKMALETNGMVWNDSILDMDYINISPKVGQPIHVEWLEHGGIIDEMRYTITEGQPDIWNAVNGQLITNEYLDGLTPVPSSDKAESLIGVPVKYITISPLMKDLRPRPDQISGEGFQSIHGEMDKASLSRCLYLVKKYRHFNARLSVQVHKVIGAR